MPTHTLRRHDEDTADPRRPWLAAVPAAGHPPIPAAAMPRLRRRALSTWAQPGEPVTWYARDGAASWAAVTDLHQQGQHDDAVALARLLHWCDQQAPAGTVVWVIEEVSDTDGRRGR